MRGLVLPVGDGGLDAALGEPGPVRAGGIPLVREDPVRAGAGPARAWPGDPDLVQDLGEQARVGGLAAGEDEGEQAALPVRDGVDLAGQAASGAADRVIGRLVTELLVVRQSPLWCGEVSRRADARARSWSRSMRPNPDPRTAARATAPSPTPVPRRPARTTG